MPTISQEYHAEVAQRPKAPVLKTGCATHSGSSNLPLGVTVFDENYITNKIEFVSTGINTNVFSMSDFESVFSWISWIQSIILFMYHHLLLDATFHPNH